MSKLLHSRKAVGLFNPAGTLVHVGSETACLRAFAKIRSEQCGDALDLAHIRVKVKMALWSIGPVIVAVVSPETDLSGLVGGTSEDGIILGGSIGKPRLAAVRSS